MVRIMARMGKKIKDYDNTFMALTSRQIERQDMVDNKIMELLQDINPSNQPLVWDIDIIGEIRDSIEQYFLSKGICTEEEFYPIAE